MTESILPDEGEHLTDGWEPEVRADDTLKRRAVLVHASWPVAVADALGRPLRRTDRWAGALLGASGALVNPVILTQPVPEEEAGTLVAETAELIPPGTPYFLLSPWLTPDLTRHGLVLIGHTPLMIRFPAPQPRPDPAVLVEYVAALPAARGKGAGAAVTWAATLADPSLPAVLVASDDGRPAYERMGCLHLERWTAWVRPA